MLHKSHQNKQGFLSKVALFTLLSLATHSATADVLTSVRPLGFIAAAMTEGVTSTQVLLPDGASPHDYALKPSDLKKIKSADLVVWVGPEMEMFLQKPLSVVEKNKQLAIAESASVIPFLYKNEENSTDSDKHDSDHEHHHHGEYNMHVWLSPDIARATAKDIHDKLIVAYPDKKEQLDVNLRKFNGQLDETEKNIRHNLEPVQNKGYFVFHDAYGYFEKRFDLSPLGHFTINPEIQPGAQKLHQIRTQLVEQKATCVFAEPQFRPAVIEAVAKGTQVNMGTLDPLGSGIALSSESYQQFLIALSEQYKDCLNKP